MKVSGVQINVLGLWKRKGDHGGECNYSVGEMRSEAHILWALKGSLDSILVTMESHQKLTDTSEKNSLVIISEQSPYCYTCRQTLGSKAGDGRWGDGGGLLKLSRWGWLVCMDGGYGEAEVLYKVHLKFKKAILTSLNLK